MTELSDSDFLPQETISPRRVGLGLVSVALLLPVVAGVLMCFTTGWVAFAIAAATVVVTALLMALDANRLGRLDRSGRERESPFLLLAGMLLLWIVVFPLAVFRRSAFTKPNLGLVALLVTVFFLVAPLVASLLSATQLPACTSPEVVQVLDQVLRSTSAVAAAKTIDGHRELRFDRAAQIRYGECVAHLDTGDVPVQFLVEWQDRNTARFQVRLAEVELPLCDSLMVKQLLEQVIGQTPVGATARSIDGHRELKYDRIADVRHGECIAHLESQDVPVQFFVEWQDRNKSQFQVRLAELELPACDSQPIMNLLEQVIRQNMQGAAIQSIDGHRELKHDSAAAVRHGECIAHLDSGDVAVPFVVEWQDRSKGLFQVRLPGQPLPACDNPAVVQILEQFIRKSAVGAKTRSIAGYREVNFDKQANVRLGECTVELDDRNLTVKYRVEWQNEEKGQFQVRILGSTE